MNEKGIHYAVFETKGCDILIKRAGIEIPIGGVDAKGGTIGRGASREKLPYGFPILCLGFDVAKLGVDELIQQVASGSSVDMNAFIDSKFVLIQQQCKK